jgi:hypothetical protein
MDVSSPIGIAAAAVFWSYLVYRVWREYLHAKERERKAGARYR